MRTREVIVDPDAKEDLRDLYHWIAVGGSPRSAENYLLRIQDFINGLDIAAERGTPLDEVDPGLRSIPFESVVLAVRITETSAIVARIFHHSRDWMKALRRDQKH